MNTGLKNLHKKLFVVLPVLLLVFIGLTIIMNGHVKNLFHEYPIISKNVEIKATVINLRTWNAGSLIVDSSNKRYSIHASSINEKGNPLSIYLSKGDSLYRGIGNDTLMLFKANSEIPILFEIRFYIEDMVTSR